MAYINSAATRKKFETLMQAQLKDNTYKEITQVTPEEAAAIKQARKKGLSWKEIAEMFQRAASTCRTIYRKK